MIDRTSHPPAVERPRVIVDCDPGHDDVAALAVAAGSCDLVAVTTVAGNAPLAHCTTNALATLDLLGVDVEVHPGADRPLLREPRHATGVHGETGLLGVEVPPSRRAASTVPAVELLLEATRAEEGVWLVPIGPLTNVALALRADPGFAGRIAGISLMGGGIARGNVTPAAEFNAWFDPDAASIVFSSGVPLRMSGLDVTQQVVVDHAFAGEIRDSGGPAGTFLADVFAAYADTCAAITGQAGGALHDPCAIAALVAPELFAFERLHVAVARTGAAAGATIADRRAILRGGGGEPGVDVALGVDAAGVLRFVLDAITSVYRPAP